MAINAEYPPNEEDLRLRNHFYLKGEIITVWGMYERNGSVNCLIAPLENSLKQTQCDLHALRPIPLSDEMIERLRLHKERLWLDKLVVRTAGKEWSLWAVSKRHKVDIFLRYVDYVHRLQNLLFDFTGCAPTLWMNEPEVSTEGLLQSFHAKKHDDNANRNKAWNIKPDRREN